MHHVTLTWYLSLIAHDCDSIHLLSAVVLLMVLLPSCLQPVVVGRISCYRHKLGHACEIASHAGRRLSLLMGGARKKDRLTASPAGKDVTGARCWNRIAWPEPLGAMRRRDVQTCRRPEFAPSASHARGPSSHSRAPRRRCAKGLDVRTIVSAGDSTATVTALQSGRSPHGGGQAIRTCVQQTVH